MSFSCEGQARQFIQKLYINTSSSGPWHSSEIKLVLELHGRHDRSYSCLPEQTIPAQSEPGIICSAFLVYKLHRSLASGQVGHQNKWETWNLKLIKPGAAGCIHCGQGEL